MNRWFCCSTFPLPAPIFLITLSYHLHVKGVTGNVFRLGVFFLEGGGGRMGSGVGWGESDIFQVLFNPKP